MGNYTDARINHEVSYKAEYISSKRSNNRLRGMVLNICEIRKAAVAHMADHKRTLFGNKEWSYVAGNFSRNKLTDRITMTFDKRGLPRDRRNKACQ